jgi:DNA-binding MarR family transcriptional regulator
LLKDNPSTQVAWKIRDINHLHMQNIMGIIENYGLHSGQPRILHTIANMNGSTQKEIADKLQISPASLAVSIKRLQKAGLLEKVTDESDLRVNQIYLTEKGRKVQSESLADLIAFDNYLIEGFSPDEISQLDSFLCRIYTNLKKAEESACLKN